MFTNKHKTIVLSGLILLAATITFLLTSPLIASRIQSSGKADSFAYSVQEGPADNIYVVVSLDMSTADSKQTYLDANIKRGHELVAEEKGELIPVQITFAHPVPVSEAKEMVNATGFVVDSFLLVGHSNITQERATHIQFSSMNETIPESELIDSSTGESVIFEGVMVLKGRITANSNGLGKWMANDLAYLVDTTEVEVRDLLNENHKTEIAGKEIEVSIPSPFWELDW